MDARVEEQVGRWRDQLLDLTKKNPAVNFRQLKVGTLEILDCDASDLIARLRSAGERGLGFWLPPDASASEERAIANDIGIGEEISPGVRKLERPAEFEIVTSKESRTALRQSLTTILRRTTQEFLETGIWTLYLGCGMLEWRDPLNNDPLRSPLVFVPVTLTKDPARESFRLGLSEGEPQFNPALSLKL